VLVELGRKNNDIVVLTADLVRVNKTGQFKERYPDRFFNTGVAEQDMMGIAAGLALEGKIPFVSTFAAFASMRACEQVRTDITYPNLKVRIVSTHGGVTSGGGTTHNALEDIAIMRSMANMTVVVPGDPNQVGKVLEASLRYQGPMYIRIGRGMEPIVYEGDYDYAIGKAITTKDGKDATVIACGIAVFYALQAAARLEEKGISVRVLDMHTVKPLDVEAVLKAAKETGKILTAEEHSIVGGLGSAVAETILESGIPIKFKRLGVPDVFVPIGSPEEIHAKYGFDAAGIYRELNSMLL
jgi:transketolase